MLLVALCAALWLTLGMHDSAAARSHHGSDIVSFGHSVTVPAGQEVTGDVVVFGGSAYIYGKVDGDAVVMGGSLHIAPEGEVDGDTVAFGGGVDNQSTARNAGPHRPIPPPPPAGAEPPVYPMPHIRHHMAAGGGGWMSFLASTALLSLLAFMFFPLRTRMALDDLSLRPLVAAVIGFFWPVSLAVVLVALAVTVVGIPLIPVAVIAALAAYLLGRAAIAVLIGRRLFEIAKVVEPSPLATLLLGLLTITVIEAVVPLWMGLVLEACLGAVAVGAVTLTLLRKRFPLGLPGTPIYTQQPPFTPPAPAPPSGPPAVQ